MEDMNQILLDEGFAGFQLITSSSQPGLNDQELELVGNETFPGSGLNAKAASAASASLQSEPALAGPSTTAAAHAHGDYSQFQVTLANYVDHDDTDDDRAVLTNDVLLHSAAVAVADSAVTIDCTGVGTANKEAAVDQEYFLRTIQSSSETDDDSNDDVDDDDDDDDYRVTADRRKKKVPKFQIRIRSGSSRRRKEKQITRRENNAVEAKVAGGYDCYWGDENEQDRSDPLYIDEDAGWEPSPKKQKRRGGGKGSRGPYKKRGDKEKEKHKRTIGIKPKNKRFSDRFGLEDLPKRKVGRPRKPEEVKKAGMLQREKARRDKMTTCLDMITKVVPGLNPRMDKASVIELASQYLLFLKKRIGAKYDTDFLCNSKLNGGGAEEKRGYNH